MNILNLFKFLDYLRNPSCLILLLSVSVFSLLHSFEIITILHWFIFYAGFIYPYIFLFFSGKYEKQRDKRKFEIKLEMKENFHKLKLKFQKESEKTIKEERFKILEDYIFSPQTGNFIHKKLDGVRICYPCVHNDPVKITPIRIRLHYPNYSDTTYECSLYPDLCGYSLRVSDK